MYTTVPPDFKFVPLGQKEEMSMREILSKTDVGREYGHIVSSFSRYPLLIDSLGNVLSFPPIINGELTRLTSATMNLLIEITAIDLSAAEDALAIMAATLHDTGAKIESIRVKSGSSIRTTPDMGLQRMQVNRKLANNLLGLRLTNQEVSECLEKSRISVALKDGELIALIPRYRVDIMHQVDLVEEIAYGYGFERLGPTLLASKKPGKPDRNLSLISLVRNSMIGLGYIEVMNYSLTSQKVLYELTGGRPKALIRVENPKSIEYEVLRDALFPSLLMTLSKNLHEEYPQRIFEVSKVFEKDARAPNGVREVYHLAIAISHSEANYTEAKSILSSLFSQTFNMNIDTTPTRHSSFTPGRVAKIKLVKHNIGVIGEISPLVLENFRLRNPISVFEVDLNKVILISERKT